MAQQTPIQRREERALEHGFMLHLLDQQIGLHLRDMVKDVLTHVIGPCDFGCHLDPPASHLFRLLIEPVAVLLQVGRPGHFAVAFFEQRQNVQRGNQAGNVQARPAGLGQGGAMVYRRRMAQQRVDDQ